MAEIVIKLTPKQARTLWAVLDGAADAGACSGGLSKDESLAVAAIIGKLLTKRAMWKPENPLTVSGPSA
jgi:hypothetical protein